MHNTTADEDLKVAVTDQQNWSARGHDYGKGDHSNGPSVKCYKCDKYGYYAKHYYAKKKVEEDANLVEEDETKDEGILIMANEGITLDNDIGWYHDTGVSNHMCWHKHPFLIYRR